MSEQRIGAGGESGGEEVGRFADEDTSRSIDLSFSPTWSSSLPVGPGA